MDTLIVDYVSTRFLPSMQNEIFLSLRYFNLFNYVDYELPYINLLMAQDLNETQELQDQFFHILLGQHDYIYKAHMLRVSEHTSIAERNEVLHFLSSIQNVEDFAFLEAVLHSTPDKMHALAVICTHLTTLNEHRALEILEDMDDIAFNSLKDYISKQALMRNSTTRTYTEIGQNIVENMRRFVNFSTKETLLGQVLMDAGVLLDQPFPRYKPYVSNTVFENKTYEDISYDILSMLYLTKEGIDKPLQEYRNYVSLFFSELPKIHAIEQQLNSIVANYDTYLKVENEKARLL